MRSPAGAERAQTPLKANGRYRLCSDGGDAVWSSCGAVDGFYEGDATAAFESGADGGAILLNGLGKIFEDALAAPEIRECGGIGAFIFVEGGQSSARHGLVWSVVMA